MERLFEGIPLDKVSTSMTINLTAAILLCFYVLAARRQGVDSRKLNGTSERHFERIYRSRDVHLSATAGDADYYGPVCVGRAGAAGMEQHLDQRLSYSRGGIDGDSGSGVYVRERDRYIEAALAAGLEIDSFAPRLSFFNAHNNFLEEIRNSGGAPALREADARTVPARKSDR
jgi:methylmalonyl-CoA mutase N-terminal domain/subunit